MPIIQVSQIIESNGLPNFINNLNQHHQIPLMSSVSIKQDPDSEQNIHSTKQFFVVSHTRDCDGTPLYHIANTDFNTAISFAYILRSETQQSNIALAKLFNRTDILNSDKTHFISLEHFLTFHEFIKTILFRNYPHECLSINQTL